LPAGRRVVGAGIRGESRQVRPRGRRGRLSSRLRGARPLRARADSPFPEEPRMNETVGFIGLGTMGLPMASNLAKAGVRLIAHDTSAAARDAAAKLGGVTVAAGAADVASRADILFTCLPNDAIVRAAYLGEGGIATAGRSGLITCDCSTVSPEATLEVARGLAVKGIKHMDTPMLGSQPQAVSGEIFFIVGGEASAVERIKPCLEIMGKMHIYVGGSSMGNRVKLIHNGLAAVTSVAVAGALAVCVQSGVGPYLFYGRVPNGGR